MVPGASPLLPLSFVSVEDLGTVVEGVGRAKTVNIKHKV